MASGFFNTSTFLHLHNVSSKWLFHRRVTATANAFAVQPLLRVIELYIETELCR